MELLKGKKVMITGGATGIGKVCALRAAEEGAAYVYIVDLNIEQAEKTCEEIRKGYNTPCDAVSCNVGDEQSVMDAFAAYSAKHDDLDVLLNCAGICRNISIEDIDMRSWDLTLNVNLKGAFLFCREAMKMMEKKGNGRIINMASQAGQGGGIDCGTDYACSKGGMLTLTKSFAKRLAASGTTVNSIAPGLIGTEMTDRTFSYNAETVPLKRIGKPVDVANAFIFLASELASYITGTCLDVNGGIRMN